MTSEFSISARVGKVMSLAPSGFAMGFHVNFTRPAFLIQNYPLKWTQIYAARGFLMADPTVKWGFENVGDVRWTDLLDSDTDGVLAAAMEYGLNFGLTHVTVAGGTRTMTSFARSDRELTNQEIDDITRHVDAVHSATQADKALSTDDLAELRALGVDVTQN